MRGVLCGWNLVISKAKSFTSLVAHGAGAYLRFLVISNGGMK